MLKKFLAFFCLVLFSFLIGEGWYIAKGGFRIARLKTALPISQDEIPFPSSIFSQPFVYLGKGRQCYAFESRDGRYVLKLPRFDRYELPFWAKVCRFSFLDSYRVRHMADKLKRKELILNSLLLANGELSDQTAIVYLHNHQTAHLNTALTLKDWVGRSHSIDLDQTFFLLQEKKDLIEPVLSGALERGDTEKVRGILSGFLEAIYAQSQKGIFNKDSSCIDNFAVEGTRCFQIDVGSFYQKKEIGREEAFSRSFRDGTQMMFNWLGEVDPGMQAWFQQQRDVLLNRERI